MKKIVLCLLIMICYGILPGCSETDDDYITPSEQAEIWGEQVIECFIEQDVEKLKGMFNKKMNQKYNLDVRLQELIDYFDGDIISYGELKGRVGGGEYRGKEGKVQEGVSCEIEDVKTDMGTTYSIVISAYTIYKDDEEYLGLKSISIRNEDLYAEDSENPEAEIRLKYE